MEIQEKLCKTIEDKTNSVILAINQSLAYDLVSHHILLRKMKVLNFSESTIGLLRDYLDKRSQVVLINSKMSDPQPTGPISVSQESVLSCAFLLIYTLDLHGIFCDKQHDAAQIRTCQEPDPTLFVDDATILVKETRDQALYVKFAQALDKIQVYIQSNKLKGNVEKTKFLVITHDPTVKQSIIIKTLDKNDEPIILRHQDHI